MSLTPALDEIEARRIRETIELCGKNRGPHDYIPIENITTGTVTRTTRFLCRVCFNTVDTSTLISMYRDISQQRP
jgi:prephenate dehydratase